jgi:uncharacterized protein
MSPARFERLAEEAATEGFRRIVVTGGEPLVHTRLGELLDVCRAWKGRGTNFILRTNLTGEFTEEDFAALTAAFDQIIVSVDGNEETHDARRGAGSYENMVRNLERYVETAARVPNAAELSLTCVTKAPDMGGDPERSVLTLGERLNVRRVRFRALLPLGRASDWPNLDEPAACEGRRISPEDALKTGFYPLITCGIGQNLSIQPDGAAYPCHAWHGERAYVGGVFDAGLNAVLNSPRFTQLLGCTVDTIDECRGCEYRYLCGGACRAWGNQDAWDVNAPPARCGRLKERARRLVDAARVYLLS